MKNNKLTKYTFILSSFLLVFYLAVNTDKTEVKETSEIKENQINQNDFSLTSEDLDKKQSEAMFVEKKVDNTNMLNNQNIVESNNIIINSGSINRLIILPK